MKPPVARNYGVSVSRMRERRPCPLGLSPLANFGISFSGDAALGLSLAELLGALEGPIGLRDLLADRQDVQSE